VALSPTSQYNTEVTEAEAGAPGCWLLAGGGCGWGWGWELELVVVAAAAAASRPGGALCPLGFGRRK
jgi:hypothetical protein